MDTTTMGVNPRMDITGIRVERVWRLLPRGGEPPGGWGDNGIGGAGDMGLGGVDEEDEDQLHYGPVPSRVPRRNKTVKRIKSVFPLSLASME
jgi:hypothetical protein